MNAPNSGLNFLPDEKREETKKKSPALVILILFCVLFVVASIVYLVINPQKKAAEERNLRRSADTAAILSMVADYTNKTGEIPSILNVGENCAEYGNEVCNFSTNDCVGLIDMRTLNSKDTGQVVKSVPSDPTNTSKGGTGYYIVHDGNGTVVVCAPYAERGAKISFEKYLY